jgi:hypothetical protein
MANFLRRSTLVGTAVLMMASRLNVVAQKTRPIAACKQQTFAAFKPLPKMEYDCPEGLNESDDKILKLPERTRAIRGVVKEIEAFTNAGWWRSEVDDLNACRVHGSPGALTEEEKRKWKDAEYSFDLVGDRQFRLALLADPCYQAAYSGSNVFLLYRKNSRVFVTQVLDGYYSRVDNSVGVDMAMMNGRQLIEISTANSLPPEYTYYYFVIDPKTNKAEPARIFKEGKGFTNQIYSDMLMSEPADLGLPKNAAELQIINGKRLAPSFSAYLEDENGKIDANGRKLRRTIYRWNGRFYVRSR